MYEFLIKLALFLFIFNRNNLPTYILEVILSSEEYEGCGDLKVKK